MNSIFYDKQQVRRALRSTLSKTSKQEFFAHGKSIPQYLINHILWKSAKRVWVYFPISNIRLQECDVYPLIDLALEMGKQVCLPLPTSLPYWVSIYSRYNNNMFSNRKITQTLKSCEKKYFITQQGSTSRMPFHYGYNAIFPITSMLSSIQLTQDVILVPGLGFSANGIRLGRGGGYYDRLLKLLCTVGAQAIGVCLSKQILSDLPEEIHDISMDYLLSELGLTACKRM